MNVNPRLRLWGQLESYEDSTAGAYRSDVNVKRPNRPAWDEFTGNALAYLVR